MWTTFCPIVYRICGMTSWTALTVVWKWIRCHPNVSEMYTAFVPLLPNFYLQISWPCWLTTLSFVVTTPYYGYLCKPQNRLFAKITKWLWTTWCRWGTTESPWLVSTTCRSKEITDQPDRQSQSSTPTPCLSLVLTSHNNPTPNPNSKPSPTPPPPAGMNPMQRTAEIYIRSSRLRTKNERPERSGLLLLGNTPTTENGGVGVTAYRNAVFILTAVTGEGMWVGLKNWCVCQHFLDGLL